MIGAIVKNDIVENLIVLSETQVEELSASLGCEIVNAHPYGLAIGDLRTAAGWTRNAGGEQIILEPLEEKTYDSYTIAAAQIVELQSEKEMASTLAASEALTILKGETKE